MTWISVSNIIIKQSCDGTLGWGIPMSYTPIGICYMWQMWNEQTKQTKIQIIIYDLVYE